jgi:hypothetical protein
MNKLRTLSASLTFAAAFLFGCSTNQYDPGTSSADGSGEVSSSSHDVSSSSTGTVGAASSSSRASSSSVNPLGNIPNYQTLTSNGTGVKPGWASRYWDGCKQSCSWADKNQFPPLTRSDRCRACEKNGTTQIAANDINKSSCGGGNSYTCYDFIPRIVDNNMAFAFAASPTDQCGKCFQLQFDGGSHDTPNSTHTAIKGKTLIVMTSNMGGDVSQGQFDILIPGGGLGQFDSFSGQIGVSKDKLGHQYGGLLRDCEGESGYNAAQYKTCLTNKCNSVFTNATLKEGCLFYANWMQAASNPTMLYKEVTCPDYLINKYKATMF